MARWSDPALGLENLDHAREAARHPDPTRRISRRAPHHVHVSLDHRRLGRRSDLGRRDRRRCSLHHQPGGADRSRGHDRLPCHAPEISLRSPKVLARIAGSLYLLASICFVVAIAINSSIEGSSGGSGLIDRIRASTSLFRVSLTLDLISATLFLLTGMALYVLLRRVDRLAGAAMVVLVALEIVVIYLSDINLYNVLTIATNPAYIQAFGAPASNSARLPGHQVSPVPVARGSSLAGRRNELDWTVPCQSSCARPSLCVRGRAGRRRRRVRLRRVVVDLRDQGDRRGRSRFGSVCSSLKPMRSTGVAPLDSAVRSRMSPQ
ncbi:MAG: DUF4386 domain-containing protein [Chloroflexi bacterium]|nr:MAG: DUF4386 domain-containing protein [Chloroflexota bacterium]